MESFVKLCEVIESSNQTYSIQLCSDW